MSPKGLDKYPLWCLSRFSLSARRGGHKDLNEEAGQYKAETLFILR